MKRSRCSHLVAKGRKNVALFTAGAEVQNNRPVINASRQLALDEHMRKVCVQRWLCINTRTCSGRDAITQTPRISETESTI